MSRQHFLTLLDLSPMDLQTIVKRASELKLEPNIARDNSNKTLGLVFEKSSTRTRIAFEVAMAQMGGTSLFLTTNDSQLGRGEPIADTSRVVSSMVDCLAIRTFEHAKLQDFAKHSKVPVINALSDSFHPCQLLADMQTFNDAFGLGEDFEWSSLEYESQCDSSTVQALIGPMMGDLTSVGFIAAPYGSMLRFAEGIDSLRNLGRTGDQTLTNTQRGSAIVCSIAQLGGLIWMAASVLFLAVFCVCAPVGSWCCLRCYRVCRGAGRRDRRREEALDDLIALQYGSVGNAPSARRKLSRGQVGPDGHLLLGSDDV